MNCQEEISISWAYYRNAHGPRHHAANSAAEATTRLFWKGKGFALAGGRGTRWRRYRVTKRGNCLRNNTLDYSKARWSTLYHSKACSSKRVFFHFEVVLLITCSVSYSKALTCFTDLGMVYHLARPALRTVLTNSWPPSGRCSIAIQER